MGGHAAGAPGARSAERRHAQRHCVPPQTKRAATLLSAACGTPIEARAAIVFVDLDDYNIKQMPTDVHVTTRRRLLGWLRSLPDAASSETVEEIFSRARISTTWRAS